MTSYERYKHSKVVKAPSFDVKKLAHLLENDNHEKRKAFKEFAKDPLFIPRFDVSLRYERELALERLKRLGEFLVFRL
jgi:acyl-CoA oxidase